MAALRAERDGAVARPRGTAIPQESGSGRVIRFSSQDGLSLAARYFDSADSPRLPLLCLPGLSRNSRDFIALGRHFSEHPIEPRRVVAVDYRGRGLSDSDPNWRNYRPVVEAQDVLAAAAVFGFERAILVGTSRGGIISMLLGALCPTLLAGVVLNDVGPIVDGTGLARIKSYLTTRRPVRSWEEAVATVRAIGEAQFPQVTANDWEALTAANYAQTRSGFAPQFDPNLAKIVVDLDVTEKIPNLWPQFMSLARVPLLAIRGELSDILSQSTLAEMAKRHPRLEDLTVRAQGHAPLLRDAATLQRILAFAGRCDEAASGPLK